jgi:hypothetical protein
MLLRRRLGTLWSKLDPSTKEQLKAALLQILVNEAEKPIRKNIARWVAFGAVRRGVHGWPGA